MRFSRALRILGVSSLVVTPCLAQFGVAGNKKQKARSFQELNEQAKNAGAGGMGGGGGGGTGLEGLMGQMGGDYEAMLEKMMSDPEMMQQMQQMGEQFGEALSSLGDMDPDQIQNELKGVFDMFDDASVMESIVDKQDEVLESLAATGLVPPEELAKFKADPKYFERKIKESFGQMKDLFDDPEMLAAASETMKNFGQGLSGEGLQDLSSSLLSELSSDEKIEEARLQLLQDPELAGNPALAELFQSGEMKELLQDPVKWREQIKEGRDLLTESFGGAGAGGKSEGAGVGEL